MIRRGFTLIELLVVITILAILAGAALPYVQNYVAESRIAKAKTDLEEIARALAVYETREGEYPDTLTPAAAGLSDVSQLTGRYLNKAPIDPWGKPYIIDLYSGTVYSTGPDRDDLAGGKYDNISVPYQPPLSVVSVKWVDKNQSGSVDVQNVPDQLKITFSRRVARNSAACTTENLEEWLQISPDGTVVAEESITDTFVQAANELAPNNNYPPSILSDERTMILSLKEVYDPSTDPLSLGLAYVFVDNPKGPGAAVDTDDLMDKADNLCLTDQKVVILPQ
ncbi:MAG: hypothetical protein A2W80_13330 [Candidatus Riflebacteria bacterium GWC2_50_8]|nr:MAG: hypothetical protein A2W80_13330 [Candidatus Riflebacteria bacterium GWC2_50_8]